jgi:signal peptidase II
MTMDAVSWGRNTAAEPSPATERVPLRHWAIFVAVALCGAGFDLFTKAYFFRLVGPPGAPAHSVVPDVVELRTSYNTGALWGFLSWMPHSSLLFASLSVVAGFAICYWLFVRKAAADARLTFALGLIMAGALGNCYDRLVLGHVRDFVHIHVDAIGFDCAIFNFADNMLVAGAIILMLLALRPDRTTDDADAKSAPA